MSNCSLTNGALSNQITDDLKQMLNQISKVKISHTEQGLFINYITLEKGLSASDNLFY